MLTVRKPTPEVDSLTFDLCNVEGMSYEHSVRFPVDGEEAQYTYGGVLAIERDTTVDLYRVHSSGQ
jgi:hypothetical protein